MIYNIQLHFFNTLASWAVLTIVIVAKILNRINHCDPGSLDFVTVFLLLFYHTSPIVFSSNKK